MRRKRHPFWNPNASVHHKAGASSSQLLTKKPERARSARAANTPAPGSYPLGTFEFAGILGFQPDKVQKRLLCEPSQRVILNCSRQWGKSTVAAIKALHHALTVPGSVTCICCPSARQSAELLRKIESFARILGITRRGDGVNEISFLFPNRSRIIGLPGRDSTIRGVSAVSLLIVDEASNVPDSLYNAVRPMLASVEQNFVWLLSTPGDRTGFFYETWSSSDSSWTRVAIPATECSRLSPKYIAEERARMTANDFAREYLCEFADPNDALFPYSIVHSAIAPIPQLDLYPWQPALSTPLIKDPDLRRNLELLCNQFPKPALQRHFYCGLDLGLVHSQSVLAVVERAMVVSGPFNAAIFDYPRKMRWVLRYLHSYPRGTEYPEIVSLVSGVLRHPLLENSVTLAVDSTGVGMPVLQLFRQACRGHARLCSLTIGSGDTATQRDDHFSVPRTHLLSELVVRLQNRDLLIADNLTEGPSLLQELRAVRPHGSIAQDDRVFATAIALWPSRLSA